MVVIDAFGLATWEYARDRCPTVNALATDRRLTIHSVLPAITPVNFATMVTGASPQSHSIRARTERLELETLFHVFQSEGRPTAAVGRALSTVGILLTPFADFKGVAESNEDGEVLDLGLRILRENEPDYFLLQFLAVDSASHRYGPFGPDSAQSVAETDAHLRVLIGQLAVQDYCLPWPAHRLARRAASRAHWHPRWRRGGGCASTPHLGQLRGTARDRIEVVIEAQLRVRYAETDAMGVVYHTNYIVWFEVGRGEYFWQQGMSYADWERQGVNLPVSEVSARFLAPARYGDLVTVRTWVRERRSRSVTFAYEILMAGTGQRLAVGWTKHLCVNSEGHVVIVPSGLGDLLRPSEQ
jgi:acyl-CoA thioester hydrolase